MSMDNSKKQNSEHSSGNVAAGGKENIAAPEYEDIINMPHHVSKNHPQMSLMQRAAQFAPFAALSGYEEAIRKAQQEMEEKVRRRDTPVRDEP